MIYLARSKFNGLASGYVLEDHPHDGALMAGTAATIQNQDINRQKPSVEGYKFPYMLSLFPQIFRCRKETFQNAPELMEIFWLPDEGFKLEDWGNNVLVEPVSHSGKILIRSSRCSKSIVYL